MAFETLKLVLEPSGDDCKRILQLQKKRMQCYFLFFFRLVLEPSGALGLAALLSGQVPLRDGEGVAVVACGGNVALPDFLGLVQRERTQ